MLKLDAEDSGKRTIPQNDFPGSRSLYLISSDSRCIRVFTQTIHSLHLNLYTPMEVNVDQIDIQQQEFRN